MSPDEQQESNDDVIQRFFDQMEGKAKREYPAGRVSPEDEGSLAVMVSVDRRHGRVRVDFGKPVSWYAVTPGEARAFATHLIKMADKLDKLEE